MFEIKEIKSFEYDIASKDLLIELKEAKVINNYNRSQLIIKNVSYERFEKLLTKFNKLKQYWSYYILQYESLKEDKWQLKNNYKE